MRYYIEYYFKKYLYLIIAIIAIFILVAVFYFNKDELIVIDEINIPGKVSYEPKEYKEETNADAEKYLNDLEVGAPYIGTLKPYIPPHVSPSEEYDYLKELELDPELVYKKHINWSLGSLTKDELFELVELIGYHLNNNGNKNKIIVSLPNEEQLESFEYGVFYNVAEDGTLTINLYNEEINIDKNTIKSYCYSYKLNYDMFGKVMIR